MLSSEIKRPGPEDGTDKALGVKGDGPSDVEKLETTNSVLASAGTVADDQQGLELLERAPRSAIEFDTEATRPRSKIRVVAVMCALFATICIVALNQTIVATAIPTISSQLKSASGYAWIGGAYLLANAAASPVWAKLSDIWGRKPILLVAVGMYFITSIICATSASMKMLIIGRACQGTAGGGLSQLVNIIVSDLFSLRQRGLYMGLVGFIWAVAGASGPLLGGVLTEFISWRWIFWINLPISGTAFLLLFFFLDVHNPRTPLVVGIKAVDWFGTVTILGLMVMLLLGLDFGGAAFPWKSPTVIGLIVAGGCMGGFFLWSQKSLAKYPLMPLGVFRSRSNVACLLIAFFHDFVNFATEYYFPLFFQSVLSASPLRSGILLLPVILTETLTSILSGLTIHRTGAYRPLIYVGTILLVIGTSLYTNISATSSIASIVGFEIIAGLGAGLLFSPPLIALQVNVRQEDTATATSTMGFMKKVATCLSVVVGGVIFQNGMEDRSKDLINAKLDPNITSVLTGSQAAANILLVGTIEDPVKQMIVKQAFAGSIRLIWILCAVMAGCAVLCSAFVKRKELSDDHVATKTGLSDQKEGE
ncbi:hypothetical protein ACEPPN_001459 [Leptodophora sp. 'Broadleaf-Isolate-01']